MKNREFRRIIGPWLRECLLDRFPGRRTYLIAIGKFDAPLSFHCRITLFWRWGEDSGMDPRTGVRITTLTREHSVFYTEGLT